MTDALLATNVLYLRNLRGEAGTSLIGSKEESLLSIGTLTRLGLAIDLRGLPLLIEFDLDLLESDIISESAYSR